MRPLALAWQVPPDSVPMLQASNWREALRDRTTKTPLQGNSAAVGRGWSVRPEVKRAFDGHGANRITAFALPCDCVRLCHVGVGPDAILPRHRDDLNERCAAARPLCIPLSRRRPSIGTGPPVLRR